MRFLLKYIVVVFFFLNYNTTVAQINAELTKQIDSAVVAWQKLDDKSVNKDMSQLFKGFNKLSAEQSTLAFEYLLSQKLQPNIKLNIYLGYIELLSSKGKQEEALKVSEEGLSLTLRASDQKREINFRIKLCYLNLFSNKPDIALEHINRAEVLALNHLKESEFKSIHYNKALVFDQLNDFKNATNYYLKAWQAIDSSQNKKERGFFLYVLVDYFKRAQLPKEHAEFMEELASHYNANKLNTPTAHLPMEYELEEDTKQTTIDHYNKVLAKADSLNMVNAYVQTTFALNKIYHKLERHHLSIEVLLKALPKLQGEQRKRQLATTHLNLSDAYKFNGNYEKAYEHLDKWSLLTENMNSEAMRSKIAELEVVHNTNKKERELQEKDLQLQKKQSSQKLLTWIVASIGLLLLIGSYTFMKIRKKNKQLDKQKALLEKTVDEKNVLLKEVHHRVKNSFQIVSSLLFLQSKNVKDKEAQLAIKEAQNRVRSMVLIHQKLYSKEDLVGIETQEYFKDLTQDIFDSHQDKSKGLQYELDIEPMVLDIETITPIGLILNELIVNVLKHAYEDIDEKSKMHISFNALDKDRLQLKVIDNGKGFTESESSSSFGLKLIRALAKKLKASLEFK